MRSWRGATFQEQPGCFRCGALITGKDRPYRGKGSQVREDRQRWGYYMCMAAMKEEIGGTINGVPMAGTLRSGNIATTGASGSTEQHRGGWKGCQSGKGYTRSRAFSASICGPLLSRLGTMLAAIRVSLHATTHEVTGIVTERVVEEP